MTDLTSGRWRKEPKEGPAIEAAYLWSTIKALLVMLGTRCARLAQSPQRRLGYGRKRRMLAPRRRLRESLSTHVCNGDCVRRGLASGVGHPHLKSVLTWSSKLN